MADNNPVLELTKVAMALAAELYDYREQMIWCHGLPEDTDARLDELASWYTSKTEEVLGLAEQTVKVFGAPASNPKKVFLVDADNGEDYEDYQHWIEKVFLSKAEAEDYLVSQGWEEPESSSGRSRISFWHKHEEAYGWPVVRSAQILEYDIGAGV